jgi:hypothetical protein
MELVWVGVWVWVGVEVRGLVRTAVLESPSVLLLKPAAAPTVNA